LSALSLWLSASKPPFPLRSTSQPLALWLLLGRALWLAAGLWFAWASLTSELMMTDVVQYPHPTTEARTLIRAAVARFPLDPNHVMVERNFQRLTGEPR
jgi:hypothetical protein